MVTGTCMYSFLKGGGGEGSLGDHVVFMVFRGGNGGNQ